MVESISISRLGLGGAMDYMRGLWDAVGDRVVVFCPPEVFCLPRWEISISKSDHVWYYAEQKLQMISTMTQDQFIAVVLLCEAGGDGTTTESEEDDDEEEDRESEEEMKRKVRKTTLKKGAVWTRTLMKMGRRKTI